ncbi:hypothetical protein AAFF_G00008180 [Aldrovandia affinis]|uniref:Uncharacterized protein n=1 Tax=Aldrovandia affinis TaxID=143900 RepID=A0AAD7T6A9_9TELE|nr:hypothetical protein AAFF_G00008180 [Aldrovandia affinis]
MLPTAVDKGSRGLCCQNGCTAWFKEREMGSTVCSRVSRSQMDLLSRRHDSNSCLAQLESGSVYQTTPDICLVTPSPA